MSKEEKIQQLVEWIIGSMDVSSLESFVTENLTEYYGSGNGGDDFETNYSIMKECIGDQ